MLASLGIAVTDDHDTWKKWSNDAVISFNPDTDTIEIKTGVTEPRDEKFGFMYMDGETENMGWSFGFGSPELSAIWELKGCMEYSKAITDGDKSKVLGEEVKWTFKKRDGILTVTVGGETWKEIGPNNSKDTKCMEEAKTDRWTAKSTSLKLENIYSNDEKTFYRIHSEKKDEDEGKNEDEDKDENKKDYNGSSQVCLNHLALTATLLALLRL